MGALATEWEFDKFDDGSLKVVAEIQLKKYGKYLKEYASQLRGIESALGETIGEGWDCTLDPIGLDIIPYEQSTLIHLINTENKILNKVLMVLVSLCCDMKALIRDAENKFFPALQFYGEGEPTQGLADGQSQLQIGRMIPLLQELSCFVIRCNDVIKNTIHQLAALYSSDKTLSRTISTANLHFTTIWNHLGDLLTVLITLDGIFATQTTFREHWIVYKRGLKSVHNAPALFGIPENKLKPFEKLVMKLEGQLMDGMIFQSCIEQMFDDGRIQVAHNTQFGEEFLYNVRYVVLTTEGQIGEQELNNRHTFVGAVALFILHYQLYRTIDKKLFKTIWDVHKKLPCVILSGNVVWIANDYLVQKIPPVTKLLEKKALQVVVTQRETYLQQKAHNFPKEIQQIYMEVSSWMVNMNSVMSKENQERPIEEFSSRGNLFIQGLVIAYRITHTIKTIMNLHVSISKPMTRLGVTHVCQLIEMAKAIEFTYHHKSLLVAQSSGHITQHLQYMALAIIGTAKKRLISSTDKKYNERKLDVLASLMLAEKCLYAPPSNERRLIAAVSLEVALQMKILNDSEFYSFQVVLKKLDVLSELKELIKKSCNCNVLYWNRVILPVYFRDLFESTHDANRIHYMFAALRDCVTPLSASKHLEDSDKLVEVFDKEVMDYFHDNLLQPLCQSIETDLRLCIHTHLKLDDRNPFKVGLKDLGRILNIRPIRFLDRIISVKDQVRHYLEVTFYKLTTVPPYDWKTYAQMGNLALQKYQLNLSESHLPNQSLGQGLDLLEIMRLVHVFVSRYLYNLNNQVFIERSSNNKFLNTINIGHVANSIRTHGTGIMNTTVNFTYQFLMKKFLVFSQFLFDENIKARLIKDIRYFRENKEQLQNKYPYDRAAKFNKGIRKLGVDEKTGQTYLDQFRELISQIGNAMGYIRLIRSGGLHCTSNSIRFIPDLEDIVKFKPLVEEEKLSAESTAAGEQLDDSILNLTRNFAEGTEYFRILVEVFTTSFLDPKNMHLRNFYIICPPLIVNFIEYMIVCKEKLNRKNNLGAAFTDDGFVMGVAFILKVLNQYREFDSLHWFPSVREKYIREKGEILEQKKLNAAATKSDEKLSQTMELTLKRLETYQREFDMVYYSLSSAQIFFHGLKASDEEGDRKVAEGGREEAPSKAESSV